MKYKSNPRRFVAVAALASLGAGVLAMGTGSTSQAAAAPKSGGSLTVLEASSYAGNWPEGLAPTTNLNALANQTLMNAIYGMLFEPGPKGTTVDDLASGYQLTNGAKTLTIDLRPGVTFSDGTPFNAAAVASNFEADLKSSSPATPTWSVASITTSGADKVIVNLKEPDGAIINQFQDSNVNWIASPTAETKLGAKQFAITPVGAGPFKVASDSLNAKLSLTRNPHYWQKGLPYLNSLVFQTTSSDESALEALQSGTAQAYEYMGTPKLVSSFKSDGLTVTADPGNAGLDDQLNTAVAPFNNIKAREAVAYATDSAAIDAKVYDNTCPLTESFTGPSGLFYEPKVPGTLTYNLAKAKALVKQLGGLSFTLTAETTGELLPEAEGLQSMFQAAGMTVKLATAGDLGTLIQDYSTHKWQMVDASIGSWDPADGIGVAFRLKSGASFTGVNDPKVDALINQGAETVGNAGRSKAYSALAAYLSKQVYTPFICAATTWNIAAKGVEGPGLTTVLPGGDVGPEVYWQNVSTGNS